MSLEAIRQAFYSGHRIDHLRFYVNSEVSVISGPLAGQVGAVVAVEDAAGSPGYLVEFSDGSDAVVSDSLLAPAGISETLLRRTSIRESLKPIEIFDVGSIPPSRIEPHWLGICHCIDHNSGRDSYNMHFFRLDGIRVYTEYFETLDIALDQAHAIVGVRREEWEPCDIEITDPNGNCTWPSA